MTTTYTHRVLIVMPAALQAQANAAALASFDPIGGGNTFRVPLNASGLVSDPPAYYWASALMDDEHFGILPQLIAAFPGSQFWEWDLSADPGFPDRMLGVLSLQRIAVPMGA